MTMNSSQCLWCERAIDDSDELCQDCRAVATGGLTLEELDALPYGLIELDSSGTVLLYNRALEEMSGLSREQTVGRDFFKIAPCAQVREFQGRFHEFMGGNSNSETFDFTYPFPYGSVDVRVTFVRVNLDVAFVLSSRKVMPIDALQ